MRRIAITILLCISAAAAAILGLPNYKEANAIKAATDDLVSQTDGMQMTIDQYNQQLQEAYSDSEYTTNTELINAILHFKGSKLISVTAEASNSIGILDTVLTVNKIDDVAFFTNTIDYMLIVVKYSNFNRAFKNLASLPISYNFLEFDTTAKTVSIRVRTVSIGQSDISSEFTTDPAETGKSTVDETSAVTNADIGSGAVDANTEVPDIQYLE